VAYDDVRLFLESAREAHLRCADLRERARGLESTAKRVTANLNGMPRGGGADRDALLAALADAHGRLLLDIAEEEQRKIEISDFIDRIPTSAAGRAVLRRRYLHYESWKSVRRWLAAHQMSYSTDGVFKLHREALRAARELWATEHKEGEV
jgi:hypothetical protein